MRQLILDQKVNKDGLVRVSGKDYRYLRQVLRAKVGDMISIRLPDEVLYNSTVAEIDDKNKWITLQVCAGTQKEDSEKSITRGVQAQQIELNQNNIEYTLFQFIPRPQKFEQIVRQATECGIKYIVPVIGQYSEKSSVEALGKSKQDRINRIVKEARQQSGSPVETKVMEQVSLETAIQNWKKQNEQISGVGFVLSERDDGNQDIRSILKDKKYVRIGIVVGSEGGISPDEINVLTKDNLFYPIHFSVNILRCETAALYGIAAVQTAVE